MKKNIIIYMCCSISFIFTLRISSQINVNAKKFELNQACISNLSKYLEDYTSFTIEVDSISKMLKANYKGEFELSLDAENQWQFSLELNDLRSEGFSAVYSTDSGRYTYKEYVPNTYKGHTGKGDIARFSIDDSLFLGAILSTDKTMFIKPARVFDTTISSDILLLYDVEDVKFDMGVLDSDFLEFQTPEKTSIYSLKGSSCSYCLEIIVDADYELFQELNNDLNDVYNSLFAILNIVEGEYKETFDLRFEITHMNVWTTSSDPYSSNSGSEILDEIIDEWEETQYSRDIIHLFTAKSNLSSNGLAKQGTVGIDQSVGFSHYVSSFLDATIVTCAHEIGHNLNADHPNSTVCSSGSYIMCQGSYGYDGFCTGTINTINSFINNNQYTLNNSINSTLSLSGTLSGFNDYQARISITTTQQIQSGLTIYRSDSVILNPGFEVSSGASCEIGTIGCD